MKIAYHFLVRFLFLLFLFSYLDIIEQCLGYKHPSPTINCIQSEREALLAFKHGVNDTSGRLSSWVGEDCCSWKGIACDNQTGHVTKLDLKNPFVSDFVKFFTWRDPAYETAKLGGNLSVSLLQLKHLHYLDLSSNCFNEIKIPKFFGMLKSLRYLDLSYSCFAGEIPPHLGNLSALHYLDLSFNHHSFGDSGLQSENLRWLSSLSSLKHLNLGGCNVSSLGADWPHTINKLPSLLELHLEASDIQNLPFFLPVINFTSLVTLKMSVNPLNSPLPNWLFNLTNLENLDLCHCSVIGSLPKSLGNLCKLQTLDLSQNLLSGGIQESFDEFSSCLNNSLVDMNLESNGLEGQLPESLGILKNLQILLMDFNSFWGSIPDSIGNLSSLEVLYLNDNKLNGTIPTSFGQLSALINLNLNGNCFGGVVTEEHLANLTNLAYLSLNTDFTYCSLVFNVNYDWVPPFRLQEIEIKNYRIGPTFGLWLQSQSELTSVILHNTGISEAIPEEWFSRLASKLRSLDLSGNQIIGNLPIVFQSENLNSLDLSSNRFQGQISNWSCPILYELNLANNFFSGTLPENISDQLSSYDVSNNHFQGRIPSSICKLSSLEHLYLWSNGFTGKLPDCWGKLQSLVSLDISDNNISGGIPKSLGLLYELNFLRLSNNSLHGEIPSSLRNCGWLDTIDLGFNRLSGNIPEWLGGSESQDQISIVLLRSNLFRGNIPPQLCNLSTLHLLDLSHNFLSGPIPKCFNKVSFLIDYELTFTPDAKIDDFYYDGHAVVLTKGRDIEYTRNLKFVNAIDLSVNNLTGEIPDEISDLLSLGILNLSMNHLSGTIPKNIGKLRWLEVLDFSQNNLSGQIPQSLSSLTSLNHLNLSYNNFSGRIPSGYQLQTLDDSSIYEGNPLLCGMPLSSKCPGDGSYHEPTSVEDGKEEDKHGYDFNKLWFYVSISMGYLVGFWGVCGSLILKRSWRIAYFRFVENMKERILLQFQLKAAYFKRKFGWTKDYGCWIRNDHQVGATCYRMR